MGWQKRKECALIPIFWVLLSLVKIVPAQVLSAPFRTTGKNKTKPQTGFLNHLRIHDICTMLVINSENLQPFKRNNCCKKKSLWKMIWHHKNFLTNWHDESAKAVSLPQIRIKFKVYFWILKYT